MTNLRRFGGETFRSLRNRNFRLFFYGQLISQTGNWLTMVTQTLLVLHLTKSGIALGLLTAAQFGPMLVLGAWAGAVADRADKRRLLIVVQALAMVQSFLLGGLVLAGWATVGRIYMLALLQGLLTAFDNPSRRAFVVEMVPPDDLPNAVSLNSAIMTGARVVGPAAAGALVLVAGYGWPFIIDALTYLAVIAGLVMMRPAELFRAEPTPRGKGQVREGLRYIRAVPELYVPLVMMTVIGALAFNFSVTIPLLVEGPLHGDGTTFTLLFSVVSIGSLIGALATARRTVITTGHVITGAAAFGVTMLLLAAAPNIALAYAAGLLLGLASIVFLTSSTAIVQLLASPEYRGRVLAIQGMVFLGTTPLGGPLVGWISDLSGPRSAVALGGIGCLVAALYGTRAMRNSGAAGPIDPVLTEEFALADEGIAMAE